MGIYVCISSSENEKIYFEHKGKYRLAYRVGREKEFGSDSRLWTKIPYKALYPRIDTDKKLDLYIQSHAINRFKERLDGFTAPVRNFLLNASLMMEPTQIVHSSTGTPLLACFVIKKIAGYFTLHIEDDKAFILTFLPLVSDQTPEGKRFCDKMQLTRDDVKYLGMDKFSFYYTVDLDRIPILKNSLKECGMDGMTEIFRDESYKNLYEYETDEKKTLFVKKFFEQRTPTSTPNTEILNEIAEKYE